MAVAFDRETLEKLRALPPERALARARDALYRAGPVGSEDFLEIYRQLVDEGILSWDQVEELEG